MIDTHCHLDYPQLSSNLAETLSKAHQTGVGTMITIGADLKSSRWHVKTAAVQSSVYATVGIHPHDALAADEESLAEIERLSHQPRVVAIGEIGLDYYRDLSPRPAQLEAFIAQLEIAIRRSLPIVIHTRDSFDDTYAIVRDYARDLKGGVFHCFPGTPAEAEKVFAIGFHISVGGVITYKNSSMAVTAAAVPLEKVILETDSPFLTPVPHRGETNYPAYVRLVYEKMAELRKIEFAELESIVDQTARTLFRLGERFDG